MNSFEIGLILLGFVIPYGHGLVHFVKLEPGEEGGCKGVTGNDIKVGETEKDENTCGVYVCQNDRGDALIHYCQLPAAFQECSDEGVSTVLPFPECCWICVEWHDCDGGGGEGGDGDGGDGDGESAERKTKPIPKDGEERKEGDREKKEGGKEAAEDFGKEAKDGDAQEKKEGGEEKKEGGEEKKEGGEEKKEDGERKRKYKHKLF